MPVEQLAYIKKSCRDYTNCVNAKMMCTYDFWK